MNQRKNVSSVGCSAHWFGWARVISGLLVARSLDRGSGITSSCRLVRRSPPRLKCVCACVAFRCTSAVSKCLFTSSLQSDVLASRYKCKSVKIWIVQRIRLSDSKFKYKEVGLLSRGTYTNKIVLLKYCILIINVFCSKWCFIKIILVGYI